MKKMQVNFRNHKILCGKSLSQKNVSMWNQNRKIISPAEQKTKIEVSLWEPGNFKEASAAQIVPTHP